MLHFADALLESCERKNSRVVVGIDPRLDRLPAEVTGDPADRFVEFAEGILDAVRDFVVAVKVQSAFFEALGAEGVRAFGRVCTAARRRGLPVIGDVKRGDIASTAEFYAKACFDAFGCDAVTLNPYLGRDSIEPFLKRCREGKGVFILARTSNPGSAEFQEMDVQGEPLYLKVARAAGSWGAEFRGARGYSSVGIVVGATHREQIPALRRACPTTPFLVPGYGAQGARAEDVAAAFDRDGLGAVVNASRSILFAYRESGKPWRDAAAEAAERMRRDIQAVIGR